MMQKSHALVSIAAGCVLTIAGVAAQQPAAPRPAAARPKTTARAASPLKAVATVQDLMLGLVDPSAKAVFDAVSAEDGPNGLVEKAPETDEEWGHVRQSALTLVEATNLLLIRGRHMSIPANAQKHNEGELSPAQIEVEVAKNRAIWDKFAIGLREAATGAVKAAEAKQKDQFNNVSADIDTACENCHLHYWYPNEVELLKNAPRIQ